MAARVSNVIGNNAFSFILESRVNESEKERTFSSNSFNIKKILHFQKPLRFASVVFHFICLLVKFSCIHCTLFKLYYSNK